MSFFIEETSDAAYIKAGFLGAAGSGKTYTATQFAVGLADFVKASKGYNGEILFLDTENGAPWVKKIVQAAGYKLLVKKTRKFEDLVEALKIAERQGSILLIDSLTHFWEELCRAHLEELNKGRGRKLYKLEFHHWTAIKDKWRQFRDPLVASPAHIIVCGRMGYEYEYQESNDTDSRGNAKKELIKSDVKMKAEGDTGYEPSLLVLMEREHDMGSNKNKHIARILKDRSDTIDGATFVNPSFKNFLPHVEAAMIGGQFAVVDTVSSSASIFSDVDNSTFDRIRREKDAVLEEIKNLGTRLVPGSSAADKQRKLDILRSCFGTDAWTRIEDMRLEDMQEGRDRMQIILQEQTDCEQQEMETLTTGVNQ